MINMHIQIGGWLAGKSPGLLVFNVCNTHSPDHCNQLGHMSIAKIGKWKGILIFGKRLTIPLTYNKPIITSPRVVHNFPKNCVPYAQLRFLSKKG